MSRIKATMLLLLWAALPAYAQDVLLAGHVQRVVLQPSGTEDCPPPCPALPPRADGLTPVCISNQGCCQTMEVKVDQVYLGVSSGPTRSFKARIGEWGPSFPVTDLPVIISEERGAVSWSVATVREGKTYVDPQRLRQVGGIQASTLATGPNGLVLLDELLERARQHR